MAQHRKRLPKRSKCPPVRCAAKCQRAIPENAISGADVSMTLCGQSCVLVRWVGHAESFLLSRKSVIILLRNNSRKKGEKMKSIGIVRKIDELGRIVLPKELRDQRELFNGTPVEVFVDGKDIILRKYTPCCMFCGENDHLHSVDGILICPDCARKYAKQFAQVAQED